MALIITKQDQSYTLGSDKILYAFPGGTDGAGGTVSGVMISP